ncbi:hypothetical protein C7212DRAFT_216038 [Tuber magnatum]|uniref:Uncharacterized protein n=1 Tax=Tuber magnatum TaxID=42249 RepID=A0A317SIH3_9PEZI|nr:hypothetical protein C7212DRAFT_216038 [Tuber magnatum]
MERLVTEPNLAPKVYLQLQDAALGLSGASSKIISSETEWGRKNSVFRDPSPLHWPSRVSQEVSYRCSSTRAVS